MKLDSQKYTAERGDKAETYQSFTATIEMSGNRRYVLLELDNMQRWRSVAELSDYLRWASEEVLKLPV